MDKNTPEAAQVNVKEMVLAEREKGNVVCMMLPGQFQIAPIDAFVKQDVNGILYDLNRLEEVALTFIDQPKWVNDFAVALTIRKLHGELSSANARIEVLEKALTHIATLREQADGVVGMVDDPHMKALNAAATTARAALGDKS